MTYFLFHLIPVVFFQREDGSLITSHGGFAAFLEEGILDTQPSPMGKVPRRGG